MRSLLRLIVCGSVDDGKSSLIGRLINDSGNIFEDQLSRLAEDSQRFGTQGGEIDFALLADGLEAEREQGITIDVAYRFFATARRKFILADAPGHEQYTRNMVTGASTADAAIILADATSGILTQTRRHSYLVRLLGLKSVVLAVNKMDLVGWSQQVFENLSAEYAEFARVIGLNDVSSIPICALNGDNIASTKGGAPWYGGATLLEHLERMEPPARYDPATPMRMPVQWVSRPNAAFRGFAGTITSGYIRPGDHVSIHPAGTTAQIARIVSMGEDIETAAAGQAVMLTFVSPVECGRGSVLSNETQPPEVADQFEAIIHWMAHEELLPGRRYLLKLATQTVPVVVQTPKYEVNVDTLDHLATKTLRLNAIGVANIWAERPLVFDPYDRGRDMGGFILIDLASNATVGAGMINFALRRSINVHEQALEVTPQRRAALKGQSPKLLWFTGLSGAGKSIIASAVERKLTSRGHHTYLLDGDNLRRGLNKDLGFSDADRIENMRRCAEMAILMMDAGLIVLTALISPFRAERDLIRQMVAPSDFIEIFIDTRLDVTEARDVKGLYAKARAGEIVNFTGIDSPYEAPNKAEIHIETETQSAEEAADLILAYLEEQIRKQAL